MANFDIYAAITDRIIAELENGIIRGASPGRARPPARSPAKRAAPIRC